MLAVVGTFVYLSSLTEPHPAIPNDAKHAGLTEWPVPLLGRFDEAFLDVPPEVIQRRGRARAAYAWAGAWLAGNIVEVLCKSTLTRPALYSRGLHVVAFDSSFPSGHTVRSIVVAGAIATAFPAARHS